MLVMLISAVLAVDTTDVENGKVQYNTKTR